VSLYDPDGGNVLENATDAEAMYAAVTPTW
jgi:hypothetical protein